MKRELASTIFFVILTSLIVGCTDNYRTTTLLQSDEFQELMKGDVFVIQTHTPYEGEIVGTDLIAEDWENMQFYEELLPKDKNMKILVYCRSGRMSSSAAKQLVELGYTNVYDLDGGMIAWRASTKEIVFNEK
jgi:phage shock protein E